MSKAWLLLPIFVSGAGRGHAQVLPWKEIGNETVCGTCQIRLELDRTLDLRASGTSVRSGGGLVVDRFGRWWVASAAPSGGVLIIDHLGELIRTVGDTTRPGKETNYVIALRSHGPDSVFFLDGRRVIGSYVDVTTFGQRDVPLSVRPSSDATLNLTDGRLVANVSLGTREGIGRPFVRLSSTGEIESLFGASDEVVRPDLSMEARPRRLEMTSGREFWSSTVNAMRFELWTIDGALLRRLTRRADWFATWSDWHGFEPSKKLQARVRSIREDPDGLLWVIVNVPSPQWQSSVIPVNSGGIPGYMPRAYSGVYDTVIEVLDVDAGALVAATRMDDFISGFTADGKLVAFEGPASGGRFLVWRAWIARD